jgi:hypothetical protein
MTTSAKETFTDIYMKSERKQRNFEKPCRLGNPAAAAATHCVTRRPLNYIHYIQIIYLAGR